MNITDKASIRKNIIKLRKNLDSGYVLAESESICKKVASDDIFKQSENICIYMPINNEVDVTFLIDECERNNKKVYIPKITDGIMDFFLYQGPESLSVGYFNIKEPLSNIKLESYDNTLIIMPGVAFSMDGYRLGYGGGFYDTYLGKHLNVTTIAVCFKEQLVRTLPIESHDVKPDKIISNN